MKKLLLVFFLLPFVSFGQTYYSLPLDSGQAMWRVHTTQADMMGQTQTSYHSIHPAGDTLAGGQTYTRFDVYSSPGYTLWFDGVIRQDSASRMVYILPKDSVNEVVLYDFNQQAGDTLDSYMATLRDQLNNNQHRLIVMSVDSVQYGGVYRRRMSVTAADMLVGPLLQIIEGIGSDRGLFSIPMEFENISQLYCFSEGVNKIYPDNTGGCYKINPGIPEHSQAQPLSFYPNPVIDGTSVLIEGDRSFNQVVFFTLNGRRAATGAVQGNAFTVPSELVTGMYLIRLEDAAGAFRFGKLMVEGH